MQTDPIADMLTRIRNANKALHEHAEMPNSRLKGDIARLLKEEGYIRDYHVVTAEEHNEGEADKKKHRAYNTLVIDLKYSRSRERVITDLKRVSKPGRRVYAQQGAPAARARRDGDRDPVHLQRPDHEPAAPRSRASAARSSASSGEP